MNDSTGTTRRAPRAAISKSSVLAGATLIFVWGVLGFINGDVAAVVIGAANTAAGGVIVINAVLGNPLGRLHGFRTGTTRKAPRAAVSKLAVLFGASSVNSGLLAALSPRFNDGSRVLAILGALLAVVGVVQVIKAVLIDPIEGGFHPLRSRGLPSIVPWRAAGRGAVPVAGAGVVARAGWRAMRIAAWLMPPAVGRRWLAEARSFLTETPPGMQRRAIGSYLAGAPKVIAMCWAIALARWARLARRGPRPR